MDCNRDLNVICLLKCKGGNKKLTYENYHKVKAKRDMKQTPNNAIVDPSILTEYFELFRKNIAPPEELFSNNIQKEHGKPGE